MNNEFAYIDDKPFKTCYKSKQIFSTISTDDNGIEFKIDGTKKFSLFDIKDIPNEIYAIDSKLTAITAFRIILESSNLSSISSSILKSDLYFIKQGRIDEDEKIKHFSSKTKIQKIEYYNDSIRRMFRNDCYEEITKYDNRVFKSVKIIANKKQEELLGKVVTNQNVIGIFLKKDFSYNHQYSGCERIVFKDNSHIILKFKKGIEFDEAYKYILILDSVIYLMTLLDRRHKKIYLNDFSKNKYLCRDMKIDSEERKVRDRNFLVCNRNDCKRNFMSLFENIYKMESEDKNALFPFLEYDIKESSLEIKFLEYYKALEYIKYKENQKQGKGKNKLFLLEILKENSTLKERFFGKQDNNEIEEEIRALRNFYSHTGYYIDKLPIPTDNPKRYKDIDTKWLYDVLSFIKITAYIEIYKICGIDIEWSKIVNEI